MRTTSAEDASLAQCRATVLASRSSGVRQAIGATVRALSPPAPALGPTRADQVGVERLRDRAFGASER